MADIITIQNKKKHTSNKIIKVDLTPMVDLGFLLITFFVFTTTMATTTAMGMVTPKEDETKTEIAASTVITIIAAENNKIYFYEGLAKNALLQSTNYQKLGLRKILQAKKIKVATLQKEAILIIKPTNTSTFNNLVTIIDESKICGYKHYFIDQFSKNDALQFWNVR